MIKDEIIRAVKSEKTIKRHIIDHTWISGSTTIVYPITLWSHDVTLQIDTRHNRFQKAIERVVAKHPHLFQYGYFAKNDGSCPAEIVFKYTDKTEKMLRDNK